MRGLSSRVSLSLSLVGLCRNTLRMTAFLARRTGGRRHRGAELLCVFDIAIAPRQGHSVGDPRNEEAIVVATLPDPERTTDEDPATGRSTAAIREVLELLRAHYQERLHRKSDDFAATQELRSVERALTALARIDGS